MPGDRRSFLAGLGALATGSALSRQSAAVTRSSSAGSSRPGKAIAFDGFPIIDPRPVAVRVEALFPGKGQELYNAWRTRQFEYTWLRTLTGAYADFWKTTEDALVFAARSLRLSLSATARDELMHVYLELKAWDDARPALEALRSAGYRMAFLSNFTAPMLDAALRNSGLRELFEEHLSTDRVRAFKPARRAYEMGLKAFRLPAHEIIFCAAAGWDAVGAKTFGYRTFWLNRAGQPAEELGVQADAEGAGMKDFVRFVLAT